MDLVKRGLVFDMQSHICWHVLGIIKKADKNWEEALKAYMQAVRCDKVIPISMLSLKSINVFFRRT